MGLERGVDFLLDARRQAVIADHDDRVEVVGFGTVRLALGDRELYLGHGRIIDAARNNMQRGLSCGLDPALPVFFALANPLKNRSSDF